MRPFSVCEERGKEENWVIGVVLSFESVSG